MFSFYHHYFISLLILVSPLLINNILALNEDNLLTEEGSGLGGTIEVEIVSNRVFDPENNASNLRIVKDTIVKYARTEGIRYPSDDIKQSYKDVGGKFTILFEIEDATCGEVRRFVNGAKKFSKEISYAILRCETGKSPEIL